ncbi:ATP-binding cassette domain-containing protein, partial [Bacillus cereus group sp. TH230-1LC]|nr:ATP-binding cassette domain-containing protein [Bacillus cereus group sp. TH230-1LC]
MTDAVLEHPGSTATPAAAPSDSSHPIAQEKSSAMSEKKIGDVILDIQNISLRFGGVKALTDISFNVREHEIRSIIGPNGAGKTTVFNCISGFYTPSSGNINLEGQRIDGLGSHSVARKGIVRTFQNVRLFKTMTALENL